MQIDFWGENLCVEDLPLFMDGTDAILAICMNAIESKEASAEVVVEIMLKIACNFCNDLVFLQKK